METGEAGVSRLNFNDVLAVATRLATVAELSGRRSRLGKL
jgi:hypothetical protein